MNGTLCHPRRGVYPCQEQFRACSPLPPCPTLTAALWTLLLALTAAKPPPRVAGWPLGCRELTAGPCGVRGHVRKWRGAQGHVWSPTAWAGVPACLPRCVASSKAPRRSVPQCPCLRDGGNESGQFTGWLLIAALSCLTLRPRGLKPARLLGSTGISRQEHWSALPFPPPGDLPDPGMESESPMSADSLPLNHQGLPHRVVVRVELTLIRTLSKHRMSTR